jgi:hypothetical protein
VTQLLTDWINTTLPSRLSYAQWQAVHFQLTTSPESQPAADSDHDGQNNTQEYLAGTDPLDAANTWRYSAMSASGNTLQIQFTEPANRSAVVESSGDLINWHAWNGAGNTATYLLRRPPAPSLLRPIPRIGFSGLILPRRNSFFEWMQQDFGSVQ